MSLNVVTGSTGFIGFTLVKSLLEQGENVRCLVRVGSQEDKLRQLRVEIQTVDFSDFNSLKAGVSGADRVYHVAGCIKTLHSDEMYRVNCENTKQLALACTEQNKTPVFLFVSSLAAAGPMPCNSHAQSSPVLREEWMTEAPVSVYGKSKLAAERELRKLSPKLPISLVRPPIVLGPGDTNGLPMFKAISRSGWHLCPGWKRKRFTTVFADDVVKTLIAAAERGTRLTDYLESGNPHNSYQNGIYFVSRSEHPEYGQLGQMIGKALGRNRIIVWHAALPVFWIACIGGEIIGRLRGKPLILNLDKAREAEAGNWVCSGEKAQRELGLVWESDLQSLLTKTAEDYRRRGWL